MATLAITAFAPQTFSKFIFAPRRAKKSVEAEDAPVSVMNGCVATAQLAKAGEGIIGIAHDSKGSLAAKIIDIDNALKEVPKTTCKIARYGMEHINGLIGATAAIKAMCADDKESAAIQEGAAFAGMLACENAHKALFGSSKSKRIDGVNQIEIEEGFLSKNIPLYEKAKEQFKKSCQEKSEALKDCEGVKKLVSKAIKYAPEGIKGVSFALTSIVGFAGAHELGGMAAEKITGRQVA